MLGFSDYAEYRRHEQDLDRRTEQVRAGRAAREQRDAARRQADERRTDERAARARSTRTARARVA